MNFVKGMDLSTLAELEKCGAKYYDNGEEKALLEIMKSYDVDTIRIRVWNDPWSEAGESYGAGENDPKTSLEIAKRVTKAGFGVLLNLHYSDFWADPGRLEMNFPMVCSGRKAKCRIMTILQRLSMPVSALSEKRMKNVLPVPSKAYARRWKVCQKFR